MSIAVYLILWSVIGTLAALALGRGIRAVNQVEPLGDWR